MFKYYNGSEKAAFTYSSKMHSGVMERHLAVHKDGSTRYVGLIEAGTDDDLAHSDLNIRMDGITHHPLKESIQDVFSVSADSAGVAPNLGAVFRYDKDFNLISKLPIEENSLTGNWVGEATITDNNSSITGIWYANSDIRYIKVDRELNVLVATKVLDLGTTPMMTYLMHTVPTKDGGILRFSRPSNVGDPLYMNIYDDNGDLLNASSSSPYDFRPIGACIDISDPDYAWYVIHKESDSKLYAFKVAYDLTYTTIDLGITVTNFYPYLTGHSYRPKPVATTLDDKLVFGYPDSGPPYKLYLAICEKDGSDSTIIEVFEQTVLNEDLMRFSDVIVTEKNNILVCYSFRNPADSNRTYSAVKYDITGTELARNSNIVTGSVSAAYAYSSCLTMIADNRTAFKIQDTMDEVLILDDDLSEIDAVAMSVRIQLFTSKHTGEI